MRERKNRYFTRSKLTTTEVLVIIAVITFVVFGIIWELITSFNDHTYVATVTKQERIVKGEESYYLIFTKDDNGNFHELKNEDNYLRMKFNSSTVYNQIEVGKKYRFTVIGFRIGFLSSYENIIEFTEIK